MTDQSCEERVIARPILTTDPRFARRACEIYSAGETVRIPMPDTLVLCNGCNANVHETTNQEGFLVYLDHNDLRLDLPYDFYCQGCLERLFPTAQILD